MDLSTYESAAIADVFVTMPTREAACTIAMVDKLSAMQLRLVRRGYTLESHLGDLDFHALVTEKIATVGYAVHGYDIAFLGDATDVTVK